MKTSTKAAAVTVAIGFGALAFFPVVWQRREGAPMPDGAQLPFFIVLTLAESLLMGGGIALLLFGWPLFRKLPMLSQRAGLWTFLSSCWLLASWWPHIGFHVLVGEQDLWGVLKIDYAFHFTVMLASVYVLRSIWIIAAGLAAEEPRRADLRPVLTHAEAER